jgi:hypothetical protein
LHFVDVSLRFAVNFTNKTDQQQTAGIIARICRVNDIAF